MSGHPPRQPGSAVMARLARPTASVPTRLAVVADPHVSTRASGGPKQFDRTESFLETTIEDINRRSVDAVISVGDLTKDGAPWDFERFDELVGDLNAPFFAVPGNHDVPKTFDDHSSATRGRFIDHYTPGSLPYHVRIGGVDLFGLDSAWTPTGELRDSHDGLISTDQLDWLANRVGDADNPVVFTHHNLSPTAAQNDAYGAAAGVDMAGIPVMRNRDAVMAALSAAAVPLVLTGHIHLPGIGRGVTDDTAAVTEVTSPALCTYPQAYLLVDIDARGTTVRYVGIANEAESTAAYGARLAGSDIDRAQAALGAIRTARFPLREEWLPEAPTTTVGPPRPVSGSSADG